jgi:transaldolase
LPITARSAGCWLLAAACCLLPADGGDAEAVIEQFRQEGIDVDALAERLQREGVAAFAASWRALLKRIGEKCAAATEPQ